MRALVLLAALVLAGCASTAPVITEVKVPVSVPCVKPEQIPQRPDYETPKLTPDATDGNKVLALARDWARSRGYEGKLEAIVSECR
jgi:PBP1b-binding outer membrane lipoprotein LpoB